MKKAQKALFCLVFSAFFTATIHAQTLFLDFLNDGYNSAGATLGFITGDPTSGEVFRTDIHAQRETDFYNASVGVEFTDECFSLLLNGGIYWDATENLKLGATFAFDQVYMYSVMSEQNFVPGTAFRIFLTPNSKLDIEIGILFKSNRFFSLDSGKNRINNTSLAFSFYYTYLFDNLSIFGGLTSHTMYSYRLFLQPRWVLGAEYTINDHLSAAVNAALQYGDVFLSAYIDSFSLDISCKYRF